MTPPGPGRPSPARGEAEPSTRLRAAAAGAGTLAVGTEGLFHEGGAARPSGRVGFLAVAAWPVCKRLSLGGGARSLPAHSPRQQGDRGVWEIPQGRRPGLPPQTQGPPRPREEVERAAPSQVCRCRDSAYCRKSAPPYLEPCSAEKAAETTRYPGPGSGPSSHDQRARQSMHGTRKQKRRNNVTLLTGALRKAMV